MTRKDLEYNVNKVFNDIHDRLSEAYDLLKGDLFTEEDKREALAIIAILMHETVGD